MTEETQVRAAAATNGSGPKYASAEDILAAAPKDIKEQDVEDVFGGLTVRVRGLTASQAAQVKQESFNMRGRTPEVGWAQMERLQFQLGVIEPQFTQEQVLMLHRTAGPSFNKIIEVIDEISGIGKENLREAQKEFQERGQ